LQRWTLTRLEWSFVVCCAVFWAAMIAWLPPSLGGVDVYLFRDAACNFLAGHGFRTASFEHSHSFTPLLYSSYTPGTLWAFAAAAKFLGTGTLIARVYPYLWALVVDFVVLFAGLRFLRVRWQRWAFLIVLGLVFPFGPMGPIGERPEPVSFAVLALLLLALRRPPAVGSAALAGLLGGAAFLCEPFAGVLAVLLIAGWLIVSGYGRAKSGESPRSKLVAFAAQSAMAALMFALPIMITAGAFYLRDPQSLERFWQQATVAGLGRKASYTGGEPGGAVPASQPARPARLQKYKDAMAFHRELGAVHLVGMVFVAVVGLTWVLLLIAAKGPWPGRFALLLAGIACFVLPASAFPLQNTYLTLTRVLFPILLASNWASIRTSLRSHAIIPALLTINVLAAMPQAAVTLVTAFETRASYALALQQASALRKHLELHPLNGKVILVPPLHYFLYKNIAGNLYNPGYLSYHEDPTQVGAVVNCYAATTNFQPGTLPLPTFVAHQRWERLSTAQDPVTVSLLGHKLMSRNWGMDCDIYVAPGL
jgi:hypothetical protein